MKTLDTDTIVAVATAPGRGGVGIVRISGPNALEIGETVCQCSLTPRLAKFTPFYDNDNSTLDSGIALYFKAPHSFTGEDVVELQGHGGPVVLDLISGRCINLGARTARPGEFSERAFLNDKLDLTQAEAIADLISATTETSARNATRSLQGEFSKKINALVEEVTQLRIFVEAAIDFPEEEIDFIADGKVTNQVEDILSRLETVLLAARQGTLLQEGIKLVIAGRPNAGKSSLLNALSGQDSAIVTAIEGTTRDVLREHIQIDGIPLHIVDTAGLRDSSDEVEQEGVKRAWKEMESADHILLVADGSLASAEASDPDLLWPELHRQLDRSIPVTIILNKCDLSGHPPGIEIENEVSRVRLSAKRSEGIELLKQYLKSEMGFRGDAGEGGFSARRRHLESLLLAKNFLLAGKKQLSQHGAGELLAEDLRQCQALLGEITGHVSSDEMLGKIFSSFCIGK